MTVSRHPAAAPALGGIDVQGVTRSAFLLRAALAAGAAGGAGAVGPFVSRALAQGKNGDVEILNFALTLEYLLEAVFYNRGDDIGLSGDVKTLARAFGDDEAMRWGSLGGGRSGRALELPHGHARGRVATYKKRQPWDQAGRRRARLPR
jgi:hypothetical protein